MYLPYPRIQKAYDKGQIHIYRNESGEICGYLWLNDKSKLQVSCIEEIAWRQGWIPTEQLLLLGQQLEKTEYGKYLIELAKQS